MTQKKKSNAFKLQFKGRYGHLKSKQNKRMIYVKTPGGITTVHFESKRPSKAHCAECGIILPGVARENATKMQNMPKTKKRPERPYAGNLCSRCMRKKLIRGARVK